MKTLETLCDGCMLSRSPRRGHASTRAPVAAFPIPVKAYTLFTFCITALVLSSPYFVPVSAISGFNVTSTGYECGSNMICLNKAHRYNGTGSTSNILPGMLSLVPELQGLQTQEVGIAYYNEAVRLKDPSSGKVASFNTSFSINIVLPSDGHAGDGLAFVISGDNSTLGVDGQYLGIFSIDQTTHFKSIVVEFDGYQNTFSSPDDANDINANHLSLDVGNLSFVAAEDALDVGVEVWSNASTIYAWVEYSQETLQFEARVSNNNSRPINPLLNYTLNLFTYIEEYMWIGFSAANGDSYSNYYVGAWTFESYGIPPVSQAGPTKRKNLGVILGVSVGVSAALLLVCIMVIVRRRSKLRTTGYTRRKSEHGLGPAAFDRNDSMIQLEGMPERFSYEELSEATHAFSSESELGNGGFGTVHRGLLPSSGIPVAVKKIRSESNQGEKEFMAEVSIISRLSHRNLIQLLGWCKDSSKGSYVLVYELMSNGSLDKVLFKEAGKEPLSLSWEKRFNIVMGTARALDYLHEGWKQQVLHRDIKSSNIMLDENWNPKLGDFGLARLVDHERTAATTLVAGTYGYISPEVATTGKFTDKSDVFAFGAVVLEIACGRKALQRDAPPDELLLVDWVWKSLSEGDLLRTVDKGLTDYNEREMEELLIVGLLCSHPNPLSRPSMRHVVQILAGEVPVPPIPASKPDIVFSSDNYLINVASWHSTGSSNIPTSSTSRSKSLSSAWTNFSERTGESTEMVSKMV